MDRLLDIIPIPIPIRGASTLPHADGRDAAGAGVTDDGVAADAPPGFHSLALVDNPPMASESSSIVFVFVLFRILIQSFYSVFLSSSPSVYSPLPLDTTTTAKSVKVYGGCIV